MAPSVDILLIVIEQARSRLDNNGQLWYEGAGGGVVEVVRERAAVCEMMGCFSGC